MSHEHRSATPGKRTAAARVRQKTPVKAQQPVALLTASLMNTTFDASARQQLIAEAAYFRAAQRGFEPGHELDDWLSAEGEVDQRLQADTH